ncbi:DNA repair protein XRCC1-like [Prorops nasuta]|uniref:DNA repair protein XRCC1-like n=1 Tax=Prorops nasuta TaxID=863751 RepID=UPI0034CD7380
MIVKYSKILHCSSEHPSYPATNLLNSDFNSPWQCAKKGDQIAVVIIQLVEPSSIIGVDIGNYQSSVVIVSASTDREPDNWMTVVNHKFLTEHESDSVLFRRKSQVELFNKDQLDPMILKVKFDRIKVTCLQTENMFVLFGLRFITLRTEVDVDLGIDIFGKFKLKDTQKVPKTTFEELREKMIKESKEKVKNYRNNLLSQAKEASMSKFKMKQEEDHPPKKRPCLEALVRSNDVSESSNHGKVTPKDEANSDEQRCTQCSEISSEKLCKTCIEKNLPSTSTPITTGKRSPRLEALVKHNDAPEVSNHSKDSSKNQSKSDEQRCTQCSKISSEKLCKTCIQNNLPSVSTTIASPKKIKMVGMSEVPFKKLFRGISFALSGYVNPERDNLRRKALDMGAEYIANPNTTNQRCTHLICAYKKTPKIQLLKGHCKIVKHTFIEDCFVKKIRYPWRRYALFEEDRDQPESEEETVAALDQSVFDADTDSDTDKE